VRLKRLMRPLGGSVRLKRLMRHMGRFRECSAGLRVLLAEGPTRAKAQKAQKIWTKSAAEEAAGNACFEKKAALSG
jgi:hypothetical protein